MIDSKLVERIRNFVASVTTRLSRANASNSMVANQHVEAAWRSKEAIPQCSVADQFRRAAGVVESQLKHSIAASSCQLRASEIIEATEYSLRRLQQDLNMMLPGFGEIGAKPIPIPVERPLAVRIQDGAHDRLEPALAA